MWLTIAILTTVGIYPLICGVLGLSRLVDERWARRIAERCHSYAHVACKDIAFVSASPLRMKVPETRIAILIAAHNEELVIEKTIAAAGSQVPLSDIYVISDGSSDDTALTALAAGVNVLELDPNRGKAGAIDAGLEHFDLCNRYDAVMLLDADTILSPDYLQTARPLFADPDVAVVCGTARTMWQSKGVPPFGRLLLAYRERVYYWCQVVLKFGQAWPQANAVMVVPGFASMYRTSALRRLDITAPGLVVEDLNMTFEIHRLRLGKIAYHPQVAVAYTQDPVTLRDYVHQVKRWALALWQTVRVQGLLHRGFFWVTLGVCILELVVQSVVLLICAILLGLLAFSAVFGLDLGMEALASQAWLFDRYSPALLLVVLVVEEILIGALVAFRFKRPQYLLFALAFPALRLLDATLVLYTLPLAWIERSTGSWKSPARRALPKTDAAVGSTLVAPSDDVVVGTK